MDSHVIAAELARDREEYSGDGRNPKKSYTVQRQPIIPPSVSALCSACAQLRWENEWTFNIEDGVAINNNSDKKACKTGDGMKGKAGKEQKMRRGMGRVFYHRPPRVVVLSP